MPSYHISDLLGVGYITPNVSIAIPQGLPSPPVSSWLSSLPLQSKYSHACGFLAPFIQARITQYGLLCLGLLVSPFLICYFITWRSFVAQSSITTPMREPPIIPYMVPHFGMIFDWVINVRKSFRGLDNQTVFGIKLLGRKIFILQGPEMVSSLWKTKGTITAPVPQSLVLDTVFGMNPKAIEAYHMDDAGHHAKPHPKSNVAPHNRIDHLTHLGFIKQFAPGDGLSRLYKRWAESFSSRLQALNIGDEWVKHPDIMKFWRVPLIASANNAIAGPLLEAINPNFTDEFDEFFLYSTSLLRCLPRWCLRRAYSLRKKLVDTVKIWHAIARSQFKEKNVDADGDADSWWGSQLIRERQGYLSRVDNWDHDSIAISDFALLWGANINVQTAAIWTLIEIFKSAVLVSRVREELEKASFASFQSPQDIDKLIQLPLLQSIYAEVLRLHTEVQHVLYSHHSNINIDQWSFPRKTWVLVPCRSAHMDTRVWNTRNGEFPLDTFWADRFLVYPDDPMSGPMLPSLNTVRKTASSATSPTSLSEGNVARPSTTRDPTTPIYRESAMKNSFLAYGIGERACPGRFFAKRVIIAFCATIVSGYDIELLTKETKWEHSMHSFGFGPQMPQNKVPFRIRRRKV